MDKWELEIDKIECGELTFDGFPITQYVVDPVTNPSHYMKGMPPGIQVIDIINAQGADYLHGNVIKYILRWKYKNGVEDLKKAQQYLTWLIEREENARDDNSGY